MAKIYGEWDSKANGQRRLLGLGLAALVLATVGFPIPSARSQSLRNVVTNAFTGSFVPGSAVVDGPALTATIDRLGFGGMVVSPVGDVFVTDTTAIRKISGGLVSRYAGNSNNSVFADGSVTAATFNNPNGLAIDATGTMYVADAGHFRVRKITSGGVVSTLAGTGIAGSNDSPAPAQFQSLAGIAVDGTGNVFVVDGNRIRRITPVGVVSTFAGASTPGDVVDVTGAAARYARVPGRGF